MKPPKTTLKQLLDSRLLLPETDFYSLTDSFKTKATLTSKGELIIDGQSFQSPEEAMQHVLTQHQSTIAYKHQASSSAWQFWGWFNPQRNALTPIEHAKAEYQNLSNLQPVKTSNTHPLRINYVALPQYQGRIGMTFCPGKKGKGLYGGIWNRNLQADLQTLIEQGYRVLVSLMEQHEFDRLGVSHFAEVITHLPIRWMHLPIVDMQIPSPFFEQQFNQHKAFLIDQIQSGNHIVFHCRGGLGRTGMIAARLLIEQGVSPADAVYQVRQSRPNAIETYAQEEYLLGQCWHSTFEAQS